MYQYFAFNILYSCLVFLYLYSLKTAPFRVRFRLVLLGLISWIVPYDLINNYLIHDRPRVFSSKVMGFSGSIKQAIVSQIDASTSLSLLNFITIMTVFGLIWFIKDLIALNIKLKKIRSSSTLINNEIYQFNGNDIFTVGIIKAKIYIGNKYINTPYIESIIKHERQHIQSKDPFWLLIITFIQRLLWWNPAVYLLARKGREFIELSCDQACKEQSANNKYQKDLAEILLHSNLKSNPELNILTSSIFAKTKQNIMRIKQLSKEFKMNKKHKALIFSTAIIPFVLMLFVSTPSISSDEISATQEKSVEDKNFDAMPIKENQAKIVLDAHLYIDDPDVAINPKDKNSNLKTNFNTHKSFAANFVVNLDEHFSLESTNIKDFKIDVLPAVFQKDSLMFTTDISFKILGENIRLNPSLAIKRHDTGHIILNDEKGRYIFELYITVRQ